MKHLCARSVMPTLASLFALAIAATAAAQCVTSDCAAERETAARINQLPDRGSSLGVEIGGDCSDCVRFYGFGKDIVAAYKVISVQNNSPLFGKVVPGDYIYGVGALSSVWRTYDIDQFVKVVRSIGTGTPAVVLALKANQGFAKVSYGIYMSGSAGYPMACLGWDDERKYWWWASQDYIQNPLECAHKIFDLQDTPSVGHALIGRFGSTFFLMNHRGQVEYSNDGKSYARYAAYPMRNVHQSTSELPPPSINSPTIQSGAAGASSQKSTPYNEKRNAPATQNYSDFRLTSAPGYPALLTGSSIRKLQVGDRLPQWLQREISKRLQYETEAKSYNMWDRFYSDSLSDLVVTKVNPGAYYYVDLSAEVKMKGYDSPSWVTISFSMPTQNPDLFAISARFYSGQRDHEVGLGIMLGQIEQNKLATRDDLTAHFRKRTGIVRALSDEELDHEAVLVEEERLNHQREQNREKAQWRVEHCTGNPQDLPAECYSH